MTPPRSTLRADAQRNSEQLIATAAEAFASGGGISLDAIAKRAGVGNATLYRHSPTRENLVEEVYRDQIRPLHEDARTLLATEPPAQALHAWTLRFADWAGERRGICEALAAMSASGRFGTGPVCDEVQQILAMALEAGATAGELRSDTDPVEVGGILAGLLSVAGAPEQAPSWAACWTSSSTDSGPAERCASGSARRRPMRDGMAAAAAVVASRTLVRTVGIGA
ncbi:TetR/AcrR family transcriptional regulator [Streptomyces nigra]|uniref:TetR/AcrR family transcriptional regulator n=1 Tax=Streptomyces nigra TaxID=1827580 RepID=UPI003680AD05